MRPLHATRLVVEGGGELDVARKELGNAILDLACTTTPRQTCPTWRVRVPTTQDTDMLPSALSRLPTQACPRTMPRTRHASPCICSLRKPSPRPAHAGDRHALAPSCAVCGPLLLSEIPSSRTWGFIHTCIHRCEGTALAARDIRNKTRGGKHVLRTGGAEETHPQSRRRQRNSQARTPSVRARRERRSACKVPGSFA
jgi:hypothetical protein